MLMTIVEGGELWNVIHRESDDGSGEWISGISESDARFYSFVVAEALAYMHHKNIVFRDLKVSDIPQNGPSGPSQTNLLTTHQCFITSSLKTS